MQYQKIVELVGDSQFTLGGYWPVATEYDVRPLMEVHLAAGQRVCLPAVIEADQPLKFYPYQQGDPLEVGAFKVPHPVLKGQKDILPDVVLCPLLAFDCSGHRLGYGGGFYDRTLAFLRAQKQAITFIGIGYTAQQLPAVPTEITDYPLDYVLTETQILTCILKQATSLSALSEN